MFRRRIGKHIYDTPHPAFHLHFSCGDFQRQIDQNPDKKRDNRLQDPFFEKYSCRIFISVSQEGCSGNHKEYRHRPVRQCLYRHTFFPCTGIRINMRDSIAVHENYAQTGENIQYINIDISLFLILHFLIIIQLFMRQRCNIA